MRRYRRGIRFAEKMPYLEWLKEHQEVLRKLQTADKSYKPVHDWGMDAPDNTMGLVIQIYKDVYSTLRKSKAEIDDKDFAKVEKEIIRIIGRLEEMQKAIKHVLDNAWFRL